MNWELLIQTKNQISKLLAQNGLFLKFLPKMGYFCPKWAIFDQNGLFLTENGPTKKAKTRPNRAVFDQNPPESVGYGLTAEFSCYPHVFGWVKHRSGRGK